MTTDTISKVDALTFLATHVFVPLKDSDRDGLEGAGPNALKFEDDETQNFWVFDPGEEGALSMNPNPRLERFTFDGEELMWVLA